MVVIVDSPSKKPSGSSPTTEQFMTPVPEAEKFMTVAPDDDLVFQTKAPRGTSPRPSGGGAPAPTPTEEQLRMSLPADIRDRPAEEVRGGMTLARQLETRGTTPATQLPPKTARTIVEEDRIGRTVVGQVGPLQTREQPPPPIVRHNKCFPANYPHGGHTLVITIYPSRSNILCYDLDQL